MTSTLTRAEHLEGLRAALLAFVRYAERAGLEAPVPTCPGWTVRALVAHQGMVHRWATGALRGAPVADVTAVERAGRTASDPLEWLRDGAIDLVTAIVEAPADVRTVVFLNDAPPAREFWARRQCHETTVHAVDALAASLGRFPHAEETWIGRELAADGVDELLAGFLTRNKSRLRHPDGLRIGVAPSDLDVAWVVEVGPRPARTTRVAAQEAEDVDVRITGTAVGLYLTLWNRADDADIRDVDGPDRLIDWWRGQSAVNW